MEILHRDDLQLGGFAGLKEYRLIMDERAFGARADDYTWQGLGDFIYLADASFNPHGDTRLHSHKEVDVISVMVHGRISHEGSLEHGQSLHAGEIQVQRAGGEGFSHNEVNPDDSENRMIQLWALPERQGECAGYKTYTLSENELTRVYGGSLQQDETFDSHTLIDAGYLSAGEQLSLDQEFLLYLTKGRCIANGQKIKDGNLVRGKQLRLDIDEDAMLIIITQQLGT